MEDLIAILALAIECTVSILVAHSVGVRLPFGIMVAVFVILAFIGLGVWDKKDVRGWRKLAVTSVILGIGFFGVDVLLAHLHGQTIFQFPGGLLEPPLTLATWGSAMVSVAGLARALYFNRNEQRRNQKVPPPA
jgi:hypothetical protein